MLSAKPWRFEAVARLGLGVILCMFLGSLTYSALHASTANPKALHIAYAGFGASLFLLATALLLLRRPWHVETAPRRLATVLGCFYGGFFLGAWAQKLAGPAPGMTVSQMIVASLSFQGAALVLVARFLHEHDTPWPAAFGFRNQWRQALLLGFVMAGLFLPIGWSLQYLSAKIIVQIPHLKPEEQQAVQTLQLARTVGPRVVLGLITIVLAPFAEEILFRGILYPWIKQIGFPRVALWGTAVLFAAIHMNLVTFLPLLLLALALALLYERTNNLLAPITAHALFNGFNFTLLYAFQESLSKAQ